MSPMQAQREGFEGARLVADVVARLAQEHDERVR